MAKPLTHAQIGQLGGFASARAAGRAELAERGAKGGDATLALHGREHFIRAAHKRWGRLTSPSSLGRPRGSNTAQDGAAK